MLFPQNPQKGQSVKKDFKRLMDYVKANSVRSVVGGKLRRGPNGTIIEINKQKNERPTTHPWKVTANGDDTVRVESGHIMTLQTENIAGSSPQGFYSLDLSGSFSGSDLTITTTGVIYGETTASQGLILGDVTTTDGDILLDIVTGSGEITVHNDVTMPTSGAGKFYFQIANVQLVDSIASINAQILTHNPTLSSQMITLI